jgi:hypothetical protein
MKTNEQLEKDLFALAEELSDCSPEQSQVVLEAIARIRSQTYRIIDLTEKNTNMGWRLNPDRMGGCFSNDELNRDRW